MVVVVDDVVDVVVVVVVADDVVAVVFGIFEYCCPLGVMYVMGPVAVECGRVY